MINRIVFKIFVVMASFTLITCGIYTLEGTLNAPYSISIDTSSISFYGDNNESYFIGYNIWYKEAENAYYLLAYYIKNGEKNIKPTIKKDIANYNGSSPNVISLSDLYPQDSDDSFYEINNNDPNKKFYFAVSAYGEDGEESEKIEFPIWPN